MNKWFALVLGISPVLGFVIFLVYQEHQKNDAQIAEKHIETNMEINTFNRDFELQLASMSDSEEDSRFHRVAASEHIKKNFEIEDKRKKAEEKRKFLEKKSVDTFSAMEEEMKVFDSNSDYSEKVELEDIDFKNF